MNLSIKTQLLSLQHQLYLEGKRQGGPLPHLMSWVVDRRNLLAAWQRVKSSPGAFSPGPDGLTPRQVKNPDAFLSKLADDILKGEFRPSPARELLIAKPAPKVGFRRINILNLRDRVVHAAIKQVLEPLVEPTFLNVSFGFRPGRSVAGALSTVIRTLSNGGSALSFGCSLDIASCFDNIDQDTLRTQLRRYVADEDFLQLLHAILAAAGRSVGVFWPRRIGVPQGSPLSPLLCNVYLHHVDQDMVSLLHEASSIGKYFRYADDVLLLGHHRSEVLAAARHFQACLRKYKLRLGTPPHPSHIISEGVTWLGVRIKPRCVLPAARVVYGYYVPDEKVTDILRTVEEMTTPPDDRLEPQTFVLSRWIRSINQQLHQWRQAYMFADNAYAVFQVVDDFVRDCLLRLIKRLLKLSTREVEDRFVRRLPRGYWTFEVDGVQLSTLSAMPPQRPGKLIYKPAWLEVKSEEPHSEEVHVAAVS